MRNSAIHSTTIYGTYYVSGIVPADTDIMANKDLIPASKELTKRALVFVFPVSPVKTTPTPRSVFSLCLLCLSFLS